MFYFRNASLIEAFVGLRDRRDATWNETYATNPEAIFMVRRIYDDNRIV